MKERFLADVFPQKIEHRDVHSAGLTADQVPSTLPSCHQAEAPNQHLIEGFQTMHFSVSDSRNGVHVIKLGDHLQANMHEESGLAPNHNKGLDNRKLTRTIKSLDVPLLQEYIQNYDLSEVLSALDCKQSRTVQEPGIELNILESWFGISTSKHFSEFDDKSHYKPKEKVKTISELMWSYNPCGEFYPKHDDNLETKLLEIFEPTEMLECEYPPSNHEGLEKLTSFLHTSILDYIAPHHSPVEREAAFDLPVDLVVMTKLYISRIEYDSLLPCPNQSIRDILDKEIITEIHSCSSIHETSKPDRVIRSFELPLFFFPSCAYPTTCANDISPAIMPLETLPDGLSADCFESLIVMPELKLDDQQFQSLPTPSITELSMDALLESVIKCVSLNCSLAPETATDWLYLDWHLAHGMACNDAACFKQHAKLKESYEPTCGFTTIRMSSSTHWSKIALKLVRLEDDSNCDILGTSHEKTTGDETDVIDSARQASVLNEDGEDESTRLWQNIRTRDEKQRMYENRLQSRTLEANLEARHLKIPAMQTDSSAGKTSCQGRTLRESGDTLQTSHSIYPIAEVVLREEDLTTQPRALRETRSPSEKGPGSISTLDDLAFFVQARKGVCRDNDVVDNYQNSDNKPQEMMEQVVSVPHATARFDDEGKQYSIFGPHEHTVLLSKEIRNLMTTLATDYRGLLVVQDIFGKETIEKLDVPGQLGYDSQGNSLIMNLMKRSASEPPTQGRQLLLRGLTALHALRYTALNLCTYGIQVAHLYLENLFHRISFLEELILNSRVELEDAYNKVERGIYQDHPKLEHLEKILKERGPSHKILLVADRRAFFTLFRKLLSSGCNPYQIDRKEQYLLRGKLHPDFKTKLTEEINDSLRFSNCLLVPCAYITDSFPIENFTMVIQYAGCANDASVEDVLRRGNCEQHILEVHLYPDEVKFAIIHGTAPIADDGNHQAQDRLSEKILKILEPTDNSPYQSDSGLAKMSEVSPNANDVTACNVKVEATPCSSINGYVTQDNGNSNESGQPTRTECDMTIVANVSEQSEHKLAERRGLYQKILCLEKNNIQFVEREFRLPVDLVLSPATCLVIYTWQILQKLVQKVDSKQISLRNEIETILKAISFSYQNCILIFEGPTDFTSAVLDVLCDIQAIAIFFGLHVQWFTSDGLEVTDKIVMKSIEAARQSKLLEAYPAMTEAPTIAEAFLTEFPSVNPLTAHAVLSSGCPLRTFFSVTLEQQFALVEGFGVPKHSLELFKAQCVFREVGTPDRSNWLRISSQTNQKKVTHDDLKDVGMSDRQRNVPLTSDFTGITNLLTYKEPDIDLDIYSPLSDREKDFESWRRNLELPNIFEEDGDARMEKSRKTVSFSETTLFREFPPASEVTGDPKPTAMDFELKEDYLPPKCNNVGHRSHEFVDQESFRSEEEPVGLSTPFDDILSFLQPTHREEGRFVPSRHKLGTSLSTWGEDGSGRRMFYSTNDKNIEQSTGSVDSESPLTPNTFSAFEDFFISTDKQGSQNGKPQSSIPSSPCSSKPASKKQLSQTSLDRFRYQAQDSKISRSSKTAPRFSKNYPRDKERNLCTPRSSLVRSYVPADKKSKKLLGLTRRGSDVQQRLVWINRNNKSHDTSKRQRTD